MKRNIYLLVVVLVFFSSQKLVAQTIPNSGFENWSGGLPVGWYAQSSQFVVQDTQSHSGTYAAKLVVENVNGYYVSSPLVTGNANSSDYAANGRPDSLYFWYIFNSPGKEPFQVEVGGLNSATGLNAYGIFTDSITTSVYKQGVLAYHYSLQTGNVDTLAITINLQSVLYNDSGDVPGTYLIIDDLSFSATSAVNDLPGYGGAGIESIQPNPASDRTNIIYNLTVPAGVTLEVYDLNGQKVKTLVNEKQAPGRYKAVLPTSDLPAGNYFCQLNADGIITTVKIVVVK